MQGSIRLVNTKVNITLHHQSILRIMDCKVPTQAKA